jgi:phosphoglycerate dehydrogenase-like enzyme
MKLLIPHDLDDDLVERIRAVGADIEVLRPETPDERADALPEVEIAFGGLSPDDLSHARSLRWIQVPSAGVDGVLTPELAASDVVLTSAKGFVGIHLAEHAMALLLALTRRIARAVRTHTWDDKWPIRNSSVELYGTTMGIVGLGGTGRELAVRAAAFGMEVIAVDPESVEVPDCVSECATMDGFSDLLARSRVVAVCAPLTPATENLFDRQAFASMGRDAMLINVTRGRIVDEEALMEALEHGQIAGAGLDVTPVEPLPDGHPLWTMDNVVLTPHTAGASPVRDARAVEQLCDNLRRYRAREPLIGVIDKEKGY